MTRIDSPPNWWGWGWAPGHQQTAEFKILEAFFIAYTGTTKRIEQIEHPDYIRYCDDWRNHNHALYWKLIFWPDKSEMLVKV